MNDNSSNHDHMLSFMNGPGRIMIAPHGAVDPPNHIVRDGVFVNPWPRGWSSRDVARPTFEPRAEYRAAGFPQAPRESFAEWRWLLQDHWLITTMTSRNSWFAFGWEAKDRRCRVVAMKAQMRDEWLYLDPPDESVEDRNPWHVFYAGTVSGVPYRPSVENAGIWLPVGVTTATNDTSTPEQVLLPPAEESDGVWVVRTERPFEGDVGWRVFHSELEALRWALAHAWASPKVQFMPWGERST